MSLTERIDSSVISTRRIGATVSPEDSKISATTLSTVPFQQMLRLKQTTKC